MNQVLEVKLSTSEVDKGIKKLKLKLAEQQYDIPMKDLLEALKLFLIQEDLRQPVSLIITKDYYKGRAKRFRKLLCKFGHKVTHHNTLQALSIFLGFQSWNHMCAKWPTETHGDTQLSLQQARKSNKETHHG